MGFRRGLAWTIAGQGAFFIIQFVGSVVVARLLSPYELGVYALAVAVTGVLNLIQSVGLGSYMVREPELTPERIATAFTVNAAISLLLAAATAGLALTGSLISSDTGVRGVLLVLALSPLIGMLSVVPYALLEREANFRLISFSGVVRSLIATIGTVVLAMTGWSYYAVAWSQVGASFVQAVMLCVVARRHVSWRLSFSGWREISRFGAQMIAITGVNNLAARASDLLLGKITGLIALGLYNRASNVNNLFWENVHLVMGRVAFSELARQKREGMSLRPFYLNAIEMMTASLWPLFAGLAVLAEPLIRLVYGPKWINAAAPFALLNLASVVLISITLTWEVFVACGETSRQARFEFVRTAVGTTFFAIGCSVSLKAAAVARVADALFSIFLYRPHLERMTDTSLRDTGPIYLRSGLLTALAVAPAVVLVTITPSPAITVLQIVVAVVPGVVLWGSALGLLRHPLYQEGTLFVKRRFQARHDAAPDTE